ncbi:MAG: SUMF1/EgtB/PvdO family nonheme iron enzyme, partial [Treponema sp.]|nr:SUMF1/EgtB/PvdO family nonheme iron enzyme [Treponema sp.]
YDMSGNVWEWVWGANSGNYYNRYARGGSYNYRDDYCEVSYRNYYRADDGNNNLGFRVARSLAGGEK